MGATAAIEEKNVLNNKKVVSAWCCFDCSLLHSSHFFFNFFFTLLKKTVKRRCENWCCCNLLMYSRILTTLGSARLGALGVFLLNQLNQHFSGESQTFIELLLSKWFGFELLHSENGGCEWKCYVKRIFFFKLNIFKCEANCKLQKIMIAKCRKKVWCFNHVVLVFTMTKSIDNGKITSYRHWTLYNEHWIYI